MQVNQSWTSAAKTPIRPVFVEVSYTRLASHPRINQRQETVT